MLQMTDINIIMLFIILSSIIINYLDLSSIILFVLIIINSFVYNGIFVYQSFIFLQIVVVQGIGGVFFIFVFFIIVYQVSKIYNYLQNGQLDIKYFNWFNVCKVVRDNFG